MKKAFNKATLQIIKSTQSIYYKIYKPTLEDLATIHQNDDTISFEAALKGFNSKSISPKGDNVLHMFNNFYSTETTKKILNIVKIDINQKNNNGETPLVHLSKISSKEENGDLGSKIHISFTSEEYIKRLKAINENIKTKSLEIAKLYIDNHIDVNSTDIFGNNAIFYAIQKNNIQLAIQIASSNQFNPYIYFRENKYKDAFDMATDIGNLELALTIFLKLDKENRNKKIAKLKEENRHTKLLIGCESVISN